MRYGTELASGRHRLCRQDRYRAGGEPQLRGQVGFQGRQLAREFVVRGCRAAPQPGHRGGSAVGARRLGCRGPPKLAAQVIQAFVDKQRRLEHNVLQVEVEPKPEGTPASPKPRPSAGTPAAKTGKPTEVGAIWSNPAAPDAFGGKPVKGGTAGGWEVAGIGSGWPFLPEPTDQ